MANGFDAMLDQFGAFEGGIGAQEIVLHAAQHDLALTEASVAIPHINGVPAGVVVDVVFEVRIQQLELAPLEDLLYSHYDTDNDPQREAYRQSVEDLGDNTPPLYVLPANRNVVIGDETLPQFLVYHDPVLFLTLCRAQRGRARVCIPRVQNPGEILLMALSQQQHMRKVSLLEKCDAVRRLADVYHYTQEVIARHIVPEVSDGEVSKTPSQEYVSSLIRVSRLPEETRQALHRGLIFFSHAKVLADHFARDPQMCIMLTRYIAQGDITVETLRKIIGKLRPGVGEPTAKLIEGPDGKVTLDQKPSDGALRLVSDRNMPLTYTAFLAAKVSAVRREIQRHPIVIIPHVNPDRVSVRRDAVQQLAGELAGYDGNVPVKDVEALLLGFMEALRKGAAAAGILNDRGEISPLIDA